MIRAMMCTLFAVHCALAGAQCTWPSVGYEKGCRWRNWDATLLVQGSGTTKQAAGPIEPVGILPLAVLHSSGPPV